MPVKSKAQAGFMGRIASGKIKKKGLSKEQAKEYLRGVKVKKLPKRVVTKKRHITKRTMRKLEKHIVG
jgi:hypothetical protein